MAPLTDKDIRDRLGVDAWAKPGERALTISEIRQVISAHLGVEPARVRLLLSASFGVAVMVPEAEYESCSKEMAQ